jgi:hypothetical protein
MKKLAYLLFFVLTQYSYGQYYQNICSPGTTIFIDGASQYRAFRLDSVKVQMSDSIYYSYSAFRDTTTDPYNPSCADLRGDLVFSQKVVRHPDGTFLFFNKSNDTLTVITTATLNQSWVICTLAANAYLEAKVTSIDLEDFMGISDSVKTITFQARDQANNPISHPMNGNIFKLSLHYGFLQLYDLYFFPQIGDIIYLRGKTSPKTGFQDATASEIYDWPVGAKFHYKYDAGYPWKYELNEVPGQPPHFYFHEYIIKEILQKSMNADSVTYTTHLCSFRTEGYTGYEDTTITNSTVIETHNFINEGVYLDKLPLEFNTSGRLFWTITNDINYGPGKVIYSRYFEYADNCWKHFQDPDGRSYNFAKNLGMVRMDSLFYGWTELEELIYFSCDTMTWGSPLYSDCDVLTGLQKNRNLSPGVVIFPNPVINTARVEIPQSTITGWTFSLFNLTGEQVRIETISRNPFTFERRSLPQGFYFFILKDKEGKSRGSGKLMLR